MSESLADEIEAINSIYGEGSLSLSTSSPDQDSPVYILRLLPESSVSLRLHFPSDYPDTPPSVLGTHSAASGPRGAAAAALERFRAAVADVYVPGQVCLYDALEKWQEEEAEDDHQDAQPPVKTEPDSSFTCSPESDLALQAHPPWTLSDPIVEQKSTFLARCAPVSSPEQARAFVRHLLATDRKVRAATHNMTAWRIQAPPLGGESVTVTYQDCDDDGETAAGGRLLHLMQLMGLWGVVAVVSRWYGGVKLGPRRFALINAAARDAFVKAGLVGSVIEDGKGKRKADI